MNSDESSASSANNLLAPLMRLLWLPVIASQDQSSSEPRQKYKRLWSKGQMESLARACEDYAAISGKKVEDLRAMDFECISSGFSQTTTQCMAKFQEIQSAGTARPGVWSAEEDRLLIELRQNSTHKWGKIAKELNRRIHKLLPVRNGKKCKERWTNYLDPSTNHGKWTPKEDLVLLKGYQNLGNKWAVISRQLNGRTQGQVKNRFNSLINKQKHSVGNPDDDVLVSTAIEDIQKKVGNTLSPENSFQE